MVLPTPRAVLFDMTGTLHAQSHVATAALGGVQHVLERYPDVDLATALPVLHRRMREQFELRAPTGFYLLRDLLTDGHRATWDELGTPVDDAIIAGALAAFESTLLSVIEPYPDAIDTLRLLRDRGIATAIVSVNDEDLLQRCVDACGLREHVDLVLSSEAVGSCKPEPPMFLAALAGLGLEPHETVFIGDMPEMDITGAKRLGIPAVLTTEDASFFGTLHPPGPDSEPDATIASLAELPALLGLT